MKIIRNCIRCIKCDDVLESTRWQDVKTCSCGNVTIAGGKTKLMRPDCGGLYVDLSEVEP